MASIRTKRLGNGKPAYLVRFRAVDGKERSKQFSRRRDAEHFAHVIEIDRMQGSFVDPRLGKLTVEELSGGTFSITNGGIFGSMLSTPILNPPQSAILGMHNIVDRPVAENGAVVIRPVMYLALSYDHRLIDGREAVQFLVSIKQALEDPSRLLLGL